jgi:hypothetical protein
MSAFRRPVIFPLSFKGRVGVGMGFPSVARVLNPSRPNPSGPAQRAGRSVGPRGSAAQADRPHPLEGEGSKP